MPQDRQVSDTDVFIVQRITPALYHYLQQNFEAISLSKWPVEFLHKVRWLKRPRHHIIIHDICPGIRSGQKDFHHRRALHKKKYCVLHRKKNEKNNYSRPFDVLSKLFTTHFFIHEISAYAE